MVKDFGIIEFIISEGRSIFLTLVGENDEEVLFSEGITALRRLRIKRLIQEAKAQGYSLSVKELADLLYVSKSTIFRDLSYLRAKGLIEGHNPITEDARMVRRQETFVKKN